MTVNSGAILGTVLRVESDKVVLTKKGSSFHIFFSEKIGKEQRHALSEDVGKVRNLWVTKDKDGRMTLMPTIRKTARA